MDFWSTFARFYDVAESLNGRVYEEMTAITERLVPKGAAVLDCAAGTGALSLAAAKNAESVLCTDCSEEMLSAARKKAEKAGAENIEFARSNIFHIESADESFDAVIAGNILHLLICPENAVRELWRVTKRGGRILLPTFMTKDSSAISKTLLKAYRRLGFDPCAEYTPKSYVRMLESCGCGSVKAKVIRGSIPCCYAVIVKDKK